MQIKNKQRARRYKGDLYRVTAAREHLGTPDVRARVQTALNQPDASLSAVAASLVAYYAISKRSISTIIRDLGYVVPVPMLPEPEPEPQPSAPQGSELTAAHPISDRSLHARMDDIEALLSSILRELQISID